MRWFLWTKFFVTTREGAFLKYIFCLLGCSLSLELFQWPFPFSLCTKSERTLFVCAAPSESSILAFGYIKRSAKTPFPPILQPHSIWTEIIKYFPSRCQIHTIRYRLVLNMIFYGRKIPQTKTDALFVSRLLISTKFILQFNTDSIYLITHSFTGCLPGRCAGDTGGERKLSGCPNSCLWNASPTPPIWGCKH